MKRLLVLLIVLLLITAGYLAIWGYLPVSPAIGPEMEPEIDSGSLLILEPLLVVGAKPGDIVVYDVPAAVRAATGYPPVVPRRVVEVINAPSGMQLVIRGDNVDIIPWVVKAADIEGVVRYNIPYLGLPLVFLESRVGRILVPVFWVLLAIVLYRNDVLVWFRRRYRGSVTAIIEDGHRASLVLSNRFEGAEKAIASFASTMQQYAQHMEIHTSAIKGPDEASPAVKESAIESEQLLDQHSPAPDSEAPETEISGVERVVSDLEKRTQLVLQVRDELEGNKTEIELPLPEEVKPKGEIPPPPLAEVSPEEELLPPPAEVMEKVELLPLSAEVVEAEEILPPPAEAVEKEGLLPLPAEVMEKEELLPLPAEVVEAEEILPPPAEVVEAEEILPPPAEVVEAEEILPPPAEVVEKAEVQPPPGCLANPKVLYKREHGAKSSVS
jgi:hypothetical protein